MKFKNPLNKVFSVLLYLYIALKKLSLSYYEISQTGQRIKIYFLEVSIKTGAFK